MSSTNPTPGSSSIAVSFWSDTDDLAEGHARQLKEAGYHPIRWHPHNSLPAGVTGILVYGPIGSLAPLSKQLDKIRPADRPAVALLLTEQLPNPRLPEWWQRSVGSSRAWLERLAYRPTKSNTWQPVRIFTPFISRAHRYRYYGELLWLKNHNCLDVLATWSKWWAEYLTQRDFHTFVPQRGFTRELGDDLGLPRDIPVLWLGKIGSDRRRALLSELRGALAARGVPLYVVDGVENPYVFGFLRNQLINRSSIMVNLLRESWDDNSLRISLAAHNKALLISEPMLPHSHFLPGEHYVVSPVLEMPAIISYYLEHEAERQAIVDKAYQFTKSSTQVLPPAVTIVEKALSMRKGGLSPS